MKITMTTKRAKAIVGAIVNYQRKGCDEAKQQLKQLTLPQMTEACMLIRRMNDKQQRRLNRMSTGFHKRKNKTQPLSWGTMYVIPDDDLLARLYLKVRAAYTVDEAQEMLSNLSDGFTQLGEKGLRLVCDDRHWWLENECGGDLASGIEAPYQDSFAEAMNFGISKLESIQEEKECA